MKAWIVCAIVAAGCGSSGPRAEHATLQKIAYEIPTGWSSRDLGDVYTERVEWTPVGENPNKESIILMHGSPRPAELQGGLANVERLLVTAANGLPGARFAPPARVSTDYGFLGVQIEGTFKPQGTDTYHRMHAVFVDDSRNAFVHVLYTARTPDRELFELVAESIAKRGV